MLPVEFIVSIINSLLGENTFVILTLDEITLKAATFTHWANLFDVQFIASFVIYLSIIWFVWAMTFRLVTRALFNLIQYPKKRKNK